MRLGPLVISLRKSQDLVTRLPSSGVFGSPSAWWPVLRESFAGAWQKGIRAQTHDVMAHGTVWACTTLIASDISKLEIQLLQEDASTEIKTPVASSAFGPVLAKPNHFQNRINFLESWILSKLQRGNTYVLKVRDNRNVVTALYVLDPSRVTPMVAPNGDVYYALGQDLLAEIGSNSVVVPATEIIHDRMNCLYHPLVGLAPIYACGLAAVQGLKIQHHAVKLFSNGASMSGVLTAPGTISEATAKRLEDYWNLNFAGEENIGKIAALGDGLKFEKMTMTSVDAQVIDQLKWTAETVCSTYHVPAYMVNVGPPPNYNNIEALNQQYYSQCLQNLIEALELSLEDGIGASGAGYLVELDLDGLLRMDTATKMKAATDGVKGGIFTPNDGRRMFNKPPLEGGNTVYLQQQDFSIAALARRDAQQTPPALPATPSVAPSPTRTPPEPVADEQPKALDIAAVALTVSRDLEGLLVAA